MDDDNGVPGLEGRALAGIVSRLTCAGRGLPLAPKTATRFSQYCA